MDTQYCDNCGLLHDPEDGECLGCKMSKELRILKTAVIECTDGSLGTVNYALAVNLRLNKALGEINK